MSQRLLVAGNVNRLNQIIILQFLLEAELVIQNSLIQPSIGRDL